MICKAKNSDLDFLVEGTLKIIKHVQFSGDDYFAEIQGGYQDHLRGWLKEVIHSKDSIVLMAWENSLPVGFITGKIAKPFLPFSKIEMVGQIESCWINPEVRRKGFASKLLAAIEEWFEGRKIQYIELNYITENREAKAFWEKMQYKPYRIAARKKLNS